MLDPYKSATYQELILDTSFLLAVCGLSQSQIFCELKPHNTTFKNYSQIIELLVEWFPREHT